MAEKITLEVSHDIINGIPVYYALVHGEGKNGKTVFERYGNYQTVKEAESRLKQVKKERRK